MRPEQSDPVLSPPPHLYGVPIAATAVEITCAAAGEAAVMPATASREMAAVSASASRMASSSAVFVLGMTDWTGAGARGWRPALGTAGGMGAGAPPGCAR